MKIKLIFLAALNLSVFASATEWSVLGPRAIGMGDAAVALPNGGESAYWNPAGLGLPDNMSGLQIPISAHVAVSGTVLQGANDLNQIASDCKDGKATCTQAKIKTALANMNHTGNGARADLGAGLDLKFGKLAIFANNFAYVGAKPVMDLVNTTPTTVSSNTSSLMLRGIDITEIGAAYGHEIPKVPGLFAGVALKGMIGRVGFDRINVVSDTSGNSGGLSKLKDNIRTSVNFGVDAGLLWDVQKTFSNAWWRPRLGLTSRNINNPRFTNSPGLPNKYYSIQGNTRAGVAISPFHFWNIAADLDLTKNLTELEGVKSQTAGIGTEINIFNRPWINIPLRAGVSKNIAQAGSKTSLHGGLGLNFIHFNIDIGVGVTPATETIQSQGKSSKLPSEIRGGVQLALLFGGQPAEAAKPEPAKPEPAKTEAAKPGPTKTEPAKPATTTK